jgi:hypothetical protein
MCGSLFSPEPMVNGPTPNGSLSRPPGDLATRDDVEQTRQRLERIEQRLKEALDKLEERHKELLDKLNERVTTLEKSFESTERKVWVIWGVGALIVGAVVWSLARTFTGT